MNYTTIMNDDFEKSELNTAYWLPTYLPQWSSRKKTVPSYKIKDSILTLYISDTQEPWSPEWNGNVRVSNLQTGVCSGKVGSCLGQHHFRKGLIVREFQEKDFKVTPQYGYVEFKARCNISEENVAALWMIGIEENPSQSAEICLFELKGCNITNEHAVIGYGVHPFADTNIKDEFYEEKFPVNVKEWNIYALKWEEDNITFYINGEEIKIINQSPDYPMQIMLNLYDLKNIKNEQNTFEIDYVKVYQQDRIILQKKDA